jgi:hypothetical protein
MGSALLSAVALAALALSVLAYQNSRRALRSASPPPQPTLRLRVIDGHMRRSIAADTRDYAVAVDLANETRAPVTIRTIALRVTYRTRANFLGAVDIDPDQESRKFEGTGPLLKLPVELGVGGGATGFLFFRTANVIPRHCRVQDYAFVAHTADGRRFVIDASLTALLVHDTDGQGPATWGWD